MRLCSLVLSGVKDVDAKLEFAPAMVLFGPNDAGKTNLLEVFEDALAGSSLLERPIPGFGWDYAEGLGFTRSGRWGIRTAAGFEALIELDGLDVEGHLDRETFRRMTPHLTVPFQYWQGDDEDRDGEYELRDEPATFDEALPVAAAFAQWRAQASCSDWDAVSGDFRLVLGACLESRLFRLEGDYLFWWLGPETAAWKGDLKRACRRLAVNRSLWQDGRVPFLDELLDQRKLDWDDDRRAVVGFRAEDASEGELRKLFPLVVIPSVTAREGVRLVRDIEEFVTHWPVTATSRQITDAGVVTRSYTAPLGSHAWLRREGELVGVDPRVTSVCQQLGAEATRIAPPFIKDTYEIVVEPLLPTEWSTYGDGKLRLRLRHRTKGSLFDFPLVGSGLRAWSEYSLLEAMRTRTIWAIEVPAVDDHAIRPQSTDDQEGTVEASAVVYIFDEPETHLHPVAQEQVASWIADRVREGAFALIATHSLTFLDIPHQATEYFRVFRDASGITRAARLSHDPLGTLDRYVADSGLTSRAQLIQLTRAVLVVEGEHDRLVINHQAGKDLRANRIRIFPLRGAKNASAIADLEYVRNLDVPIAILFDNVSAHALDGDHELRSDTLEVRALKHLRSSWPSDQTQPEVLPFDLPDIICALPNEAVDAVMRRDGGAAFPGWALMIADYKTLPIRERADFKTYAARRTGLVFDVRTINKILSHTPQRLAENSPLFRPIQRLLALAS
jgi:hypothetical protein